MDLIERGTGGLTDKQIMNDDSLWPLSRYVFARCYGIEWAREWPNYDDAYEERYGLD